MRLRISGVGRSARRDCYQLALTTPGICPWSASSRKQIRHMPKSRRKPRGRPQRLQRLRFRPLNFSFMRVLAMSALVATPSPLISPYAFRKGMFMSASSSRDSSSDFAVVTNVMSMPMSCITLS